MVGWQWLFTRLSTALKCTQRLKCIMQQANEKTCAINTVPFLYSKAATVLKLFLTNTAPVHIVVDLLAVLETFTGS